MVSGAGRIGLSVLATKALGEGATEVTIAYDPDTRAVMIYGPSAKIKKLQPHAADWIKLNVNKKSTAVDFAASQLFRFGFAEPLYNFSDSGNQSFAATCDEKQQIVSFTIPAGAIAKRPVTPRKKKEPKVQTGTAAAPAETEGELMLETA
jgi:hypothetical protein